MSYMIINKSDSFLTFSLVGKEETTLGFGQRLTGIHDKNVTPQLKAMASRGDIALIYETDREPEAKVGFASKKKIKSKENKEIKE